MGPLLRNQAVTKQIVAAFSFTLNTNLNTTSRQLISGAIGTPLCSCLCVQILCSNPVFKFCVQILCSNSVFKLWLGNCKSTSFLIQIDNDESKENLRRAIFFCLVSIYRFRFIRAYIKPEPNLTKAINTPPPSANAGTQDAYASHYDKSAAHPTVVNININELAHFDRTSVANSAQERELMAAMEEKIAESIYSSILI